MDPQGCSWCPPYRTQNNLHYIKIEVVKVNTKRNKYIVVSTVCGVYNHNISQIFHQWFVHVSIYRLIWMARKGITKGLPTNLPNLKEPWTICILTKATKTIRVNNINVSNFTSGSMLQIYFAFSMFKAFTNLPPHLWLYVMKLHTPLVLYP